MYIVTFSDVNICTYFIGAFMLSDCLYVLVFYISVFDLCILLRVLLCQLDYEKKKELSIDMLMLY